MYLTRPSEKQPIQSVKRGQNLAKKTDLEGDWMIVPSITSTSHGNRWVLLPCKGQSMSRFIMKLSVKHVGSEVKSIFYDKGCGVVVCFSFNNEIWPSSDKTASEAVSIHNSCTSSNLYWRLAHSFHLFLLQRMLLRPLCCKPLKMILIRFWQDGPD